MFDSYTFITAFTLQIFKVYIDFFETSCMSMGCLVILKLININIKSFEALLKLKFLKMFIKIFLFLFITIGIKNYKYYL